MRCCRSPSSHLFELLLALQHGNDLERLGERVEACALLCERRILRGDPEAEGSKVMLEEMVFTRSLRMASPRSS